MGHRIFEDEKGRKWTVWLVTPMGVERRGEAAEGTAAAAIRGGVERRKSPTYRRPSSVLAGFEHGWLCFEAEGGEKRRLVPVPEAWQAASDDDLRRLCRLAKRVVRCEVD